MHQYISALLRQIINHIFDRFCSWNERIDESNTELIGFPKYNHLPYSLKNISTLNASHPHIAQVHCKAWIIRRKAQVYRFIAIFIVQTFQCFALPREQSESSKSSDNKGL